MTRLPAVLAAQVRPRWSTECTVEQFTESLLADGRAVADVLAELGDRIDAHGEVSGCCGNGCNTRGWWQPFPCPTRLFYLAAREHLSSSAAAAHRAPLSQHGWARGQPRRLGGQAPVIKDPFDTLRVGRPKVHETPAARRPAPVALDPSVPHPARRYDYWLGGKDNFAADRASGDKVAAVFPTIRTAAAENRRFLRRAVTFLAGEAGIRQFLDIGTGLPAAGNTHEVAQSIDPTARVVYADNDPMVLAHARALLTSSPEGVTAYLDADLRDPDTLLAAADLHRTLDLTQPVGLLLVAILHFLADEDDPYAVVARLVAALAPGSYLVASHATKDLLAPDVAARADAATAESRIDLRFRGRAEFARFFTGLDLVSPGIECVSGWRADQEPTPRPSPAEVAVYGAVARIR